MGLFGDNQNAHRFGLADDNVVEEATQTDIVGDQVDELKRMRTGFQSWNKRSVGWNWFGKGRVYCYS